MPRHTFAAPPRAPGLAAGAVGAAASHLAAVVPDRAELAAARFPRRRNNRRSGRVRPGLRCGADAAIVARCLSRCGRNAPHRHHLMAAASREDSRAELCRKHHNVPGVCTIVMVAQTQRCSNFWEMEGRRTYIQIESCCANVRGKKCRSHHLFWISRHFESITEIASMQWLVDHGTLKSFLVKVGLILTHSDSSGSFFAVFSATTTLAMGL